MWSPKGQRQVGWLSQPACAVNSTPCSGYVGQQITVSATAVEGATAPNPGTPTGLAVSLGSTSPSSTCTLSTTTASGNTYSVTITLNEAGTCTVNATAASGTGPGNLPFGQATAQVPIAVSTITTPGVPALVVNQATWIGDFGVGYSGGFTSGANPVGGSFAVNSLGDVIDGNSYGAAIQIWTPSSSNGYPVTYTKTSIPMPSGRAKMSGRLGGCGKQIFTVQTSTMVSFGRFHSSMALTPQRCHRGQPPHPPALPAHSRVHADPQGCQARIRPTMVPDSFQILEVGEAH